MRIKGKRYGSVLEMLEDQDPEFAEEFREYRAAWAMLYVEEHRISLSPAPDGAEAWRAMFVLNGTRHSVFDRTAVEAVKKARVAIELGTAPVSKEPGE